MSRQLFLAALCCTSLVACADAALPTAGPSATPVANILPEQPCDPTLTICDGWTGGGSTSDGPWPFYHTVSLAEVRAAGDPEPTSPGIYLGESFAPQQCFAEHNPGGFVDGDRDWLSDSCEFELARAFAPEMRFSAEETCGRGEPYWAAKYFPGKGLNGQGVVRLAYMPSYYEDCGTYYLQLKDHSGDSEFIMVEVEFNSHSRHWQFRRMWLSSHAGTEADRSEWVEDGFDGARYGTHRRLGRPQVWVAVRKHANYKSLERCNNYLYFRVGAAAEKCFEPVNPIRFPVLSERNVGSRHVYRAGVYSQHKFQGNGRQEWFYHLSGGVSFNGWNSSLWGDRAGAYDNFLRSDKFEVWGWNDMGPGPAAPDYNFRVAINGLGTMYEYTYTTWTAAVSYGTAPFAIEWFVDGVPAGTGPTFSRSADAAGTEFTIQAHVQDATGQVVQNSKRVVVTRPKPQPDGL